MNPKPWLATYRENGIAESVNADAYPSVVHMLDEAMQRYADQPAFRAFGQTLSFADVDRQSAAFAAWLQQRLGVKKGDRIAVMLPNLLAFPIACIGILRAGAVQVNVNPLYTPRELEHQLQDSGSETLVIFNGSTPTLAEVAAQAGIKTVITVAPGDGTGAALPSPPVDARLVGSIAFADALREGASMTRTPVALNGDDLIFLQYTGGTTGLSKGAALSHRNLVANVEQFKATMPSAVRPGQEVIVTAIPLYHIFALMVNFLTYFSAGAESWLVANPRDMDGFVETLKQSKPTVFMGVNTLYAGLVMHPKIREVDFSRLHLAGGGGAAVVGAVSDKWKAITGQFIREGYGLSETSPVLSFNPASIQAFSGTTGLPLPGTDIKLLDDAGHEVPLGCSRSTWAAFSVPWPWRPCSSSGAARCGPRRSSWSCPRTGCPRCAAWPRACTSAPASSSSGWAASSWPCRCCCGCCPPFRRRPRAPLNRPSTTAWRASWAVRCSRCSRRWVSTGKLPLRWCPPWRRARWWSVRWARCMRCRPRATKLRRNWVR
jgi:long-chain acyl-CoA synthetase